jgi:peptidoglycan/xylan/chitin deacetylase (PgdA/CDA1 family)
MNTPNQSHFVISLDFELMWGVRDQLSIAQYGVNVRGVRSALPRILDLFDKFDIRATWATVGFLFCETKEELIAGLPELRPTYRNAAFSNYSYLSEIGSNEKDDPYYFGFSLLKEIMSRPSQEIATHTFSHYYSLEEGQTPDQFQADIEAATAAAMRRGIKLKSIVFPRNQYAAKHLEIACACGLSTFRGNERSWLYQPALSDEQFMLRRAGRLADHYLNLTGHHVQHPKPNGGLMEVASSRFLRPYSSALTPLDNLRLSRIKRAIDAAATDNGIFHLWWHPHNFGLNTDENLSFLNAILSHFARVRETTGICSSRMDDFS